MTIAGRAVRWTTAAPVLALLVLAAARGRDLPGFVAAVVGLVLAAAVLAANP